MKRGMTAICGAIALILLGASTKAQAWDPFRTENSNVETGNARMAAGDAAGALAAYEMAAQQHPSNPRVALNRGLALMESGDLPAAREAFVQAADPDATDEIRAAAYYDLGLAFYREGDAAATEEDHEQAQSHFREAADAFRRSLRVQPGDRDTAWNLELALRRIQEQEEAQEQEEQEQQEQEQQQEGEEGDEEQEGQEGEEGNENEGQEGDEQNEGQEGDEQNEGEEGNQGDEQNEGQEGDEQEQGQEGNEGDEQNEGQGDPQDEQEGEQGDDQEAGGEDQQGGDDNADSRPEQGEQMEGGQRSHADRVLDALQDSEQSLERARARARASREGRRVLRDW